jgi:hypothetical protein
MTALEARMLLDLEGTTLPWCFNLRYTTPLVDCRVCKFDLILKTSQKEVNHPAHPAEDDEDDHPDRQNHGASRL